jgi:hypothetical protein
VVNQSTAADGQQDAEREPRFWYGLIAFATFMLMLQGAFHIVGGFVALFEEDSYVVGRRGLMVTVDYTVWGVAHMALGVGLLLAAYALFWGKTWGRIVAVVMAMASAITCLAFLAANPFWFGLMIVLDVLVIYAVTTHGGKEREF